MGLFFYTKISSIISIGDLPTTNIIEPLLYYSLIGFFFALVYRSTDNLRLTILCHSFFNFLNHAKPIWIFVYNYIYYHFFR
ncbi:CPBP family glutamic-type intramembrane protease [Streptococcus pneumoniae]|nr:CPBP family glutamic-type intramembrane protease [Streptococcus pneumoniae]MDG8313391.1 CPBP family glutamic-type intramembrane protease [Streptococcus pneumoniae]